MYARVHCVHFMLSQYHKFTKNCCCFFKKKRKDLVSPKHTHTNFMRKKEKRNLSAWSPSIDRFFIDCKLNKAENKVFFL